MIRFDPKGQRASTEKPEVPDQEIPSHSQLLVSQERNSPGMSPGEEFPLTIVPAHCFISDAESHVLPCLLLLPHCQEGRRKFNIMLVLTTHFFLISMDFLSKCIFSYPDR